MTQTKPHRLSDFFDASQVKSDGDFLLLDKVDTTESGALVYTAQSDFLETALKNEHVTALLVDSELADSVAKSNKAYAVVESPRLEFFLLYKRLVEDGWLGAQIKPGIGEDCVIHPDASISKLARIGDRVHIEAGARIADHSVIGNDVYIGQNVVIGEQGLVPLIDREGKAQRFPFAGHVTVGDRCKIYSGTTIGRSIFSKPTSIGSDTYIGPLTNIAHDARIGKHCLIAGNCLLAGGVQVDDGAKIWASSSIAQWRRIGKDAVVLMASVVIDDIEAGAIVSGNYARCHRAHIRDHRRKLEQDKD